jgi:Mg2+/citrate symporter
MGFLRVLLGFLVVLVAIYFVLSVVLRLRERRRLAEEWEAGDQLVDRDIWMRDGMAEYDRSLRKRLLWLVIVLPMAGLMILLYLLNVS